MVNTRVYQIKQLNKKNVQADIQKTLLEGKLVVFPTETVYGIGANALSETGIKNIYQVKGRPSDNPLIMHIADEKQIKDYTKNHQAYVQSLMDVFWPGPLTLVMEKRENVPDIITGGLETVGIRYPSNSIARKIIRIAGVPICAPSANISGRPSSTLFDHVYDDFNGKVDIIIDGGKSEVGLESTVLDVTKSKPIILRPGMITKAMLEDVVGPVDMSSVLSRDDIPKAPGMKYKHYAPKGRLVVVNGNASDVINYMIKKVSQHHQKNEKAGVIVTNKYKDKVQADLVFSIGEETNELEIASNLFVGLRAMDKAEVAYIYSMSFDKGAYGEAIMNRLLKAANHQVIQIK